jgi:hypothetical protein
MSNSLFQYLTHRDTSFRGFAVFALSQSDWWRYKIVKGIVYDIPDEYTFVETIYISRKDLDIISNKVLYCKNLYCSSNYLRELPLLPYCQYLSCYHNFLNSLPSLPYCKYLNCNGNNIKDFSMLNRSCYIEEDMDNIFYS